MKTPRFASLIGAFAALLVPGLEAQPTAVPVAAVAVSPVGPVIVNPSGPFVAVATTALPSTGTVTPPLSAGETSLVLDVAFGLRAVPPSRVTVPFGETLRITGPSFGGRPVQWLKNNQALAGATSNPLVISRITAADAGTYLLVNNEPNVPSLPSQSLILGVGPTDRLINVSNRGVLAAGSGPVFTAGFVVVGGTGQSKKIIVRAIGPTLAAFGVANPLRQPVLRLFDSAGKVYDNGYVYPAVVGGLTYAEDLAASLAKVGAFAIPANTLDIVVMMPFTPGSYTAQVSSGDRTAGDVLLEIYEVP